MQLYVMYMDRILSNYHCCSLYFQDSVHYYTMGTVRNYSFFETLALANSPFNLLDSNKLNTHTKRKTEYFSF